MAKADVKMPDEFLARISRLGTQTDRIAEKILQAGGEIALAKVKTSSQSAKPFLKPAKSAVKKQCVEAMKSAFKKEVERL